jgi:hypothetical protein
METPRARFRDCGVLGSGPLNSGPLNSGPLGEGPLGEGPLGESTLDEGELVSGGGASRFSKISIRPSRFLLIPGFLSSPQSPIITRSSGLPSSGACLVPAVFQLWKTMPVPNQDSYPQPRLEDNACPHVCPCLFKTMPVPMFPVPMFPVPMFP